MPVDLHLALFPLFAPLFTPLLSALSAAAAPVRLSASDPPSLWPTVLMFVPVLYVAVATPFLVVFDVRHRRLPNLIVLPGIGVVAVCAAAAALLAHTDAAGTALAAGVTLLVFATFRVAGALASGDVKLAVLLAAALAPLASASLALYALAGSTTALTAGLVGVLLLARHHGARGIPLGPFLLLGFWAAVAAALVLPPA